jgi:hypothetical protein
MSEDEEDKYDLYERLHTIGNRLLNAKKKKLFTLYGFKQCVECRHFYFSLFEDLSYQARCSVFDKTLTHKNPVVECNNYCEATAINMSDIQMATLINPHEKKIIPVGFERKGKANDGKER